MISAARPVASSASARSSTSAAWPSIHRVFSDVPRLTVGQFGDTAPEGKRLLEASHRLAGVAGRCGIASESGGRFVTRRINLALGEGPTRPLRQNEAVAQGATQRGDVGLQGFGGGAWRILTPEQFDEGVGRDDRAVVQPEHREDGTRFGARDRDGCSVLSDLERSQNPQFHGLKRSHVPDRPGGRFNTRSRSSKGRRAGWLSCRKAATFGRPDPGQARRPDNDYLHLVASLSGPDQPRAQRGSRGRNRRHRHSQVPGW